MLLVLAAVMAVVVMVLVSVTVICFYGGFIDGHCCVFFGVFLPWG